MKPILLISLKFYKGYLSPFLPPSCRFVPTCSEYAYQAIEKYGAAKGTWEGLCRLCRCHPLHKGGYDPIP